MSTFPGTVRFTETKLYETMGTIPYQYDIPLFLQKRIQRNSDIQPTVADQVRKQLWSYPHVYDLKVRKPVAEHEGKNGLVEPVTRCVKPTSAFKRDLAVDRDWNLPPNLYNIQEVGSHKLQSKVPFNSSAARNNTTLYGHCMLATPDGASKFYDVPGSLDQLSTGWNRYKSKFLSNARKRRPCLRFMITKLQGCWRDPHEPGPNSYYPKNFTLEKTIVPKSTRRQKTKFFIPRNSSVPIKEMSYTETTAGAGLPEPGRYYVSDIACPCQRGKLFHPEIWHEIEVQKRLQFRRQPFNRINEAIYCSCSILRRIPGNGHTSVFKSKTFRFPLRRLRPFKNVEGKLKMQHSEKYFRIITKPNRKPISFIEVDMTPQPRRLQFNTIVSVRTRCKLKVNRKVAFLSSVPRFPGQAAIGIKLTNISKSRPKPRLIEDEDRRKTVVAGKKVQAARESTFRRLNQPMRLSKRHLEARDKMFTFAPLPPQKLLVRPEDFGDYKKKTESFTFKTNVEDFYRDEFKSKME